MDLEAYKQRAAVLKAMAHPSRLAIIEALAEGERCVCELQQLVGADMSTVSKHLALMKQTGLVRDRKQGLKVFYALEIQCVHGFLACIDSVLQSRSNACSRAIRSAVPEMQPAGPAK